MASDHYVSQIHLRQFNNSQGLLHAILKKDQKTFTNTSRAFCEAEFGSTNKYLEEPRAIEGFLKLIEPRYGDAVKHLRDVNFGPEDIFVISGFIAYVMWFSPAGTRIHTDPLTHVLDTTGRRLDAAGKLPKAPEQLGGLSFSELLDQGKISIKVDPKYPQAIGVTGLHKQISAFGNFDWEVLKNPFADSPFFTSDYPVAIEPSGWNGILNRIVPLAPDLAVRICPKPLDEQRPPSDFSAFRYRVPKLDRRDIIEINRLIVRCAETIVFFSKTQPWIKKFVKANSNYRIEPKSYKIPSGDGGILQLSTSVVTDEIHETDTTMQS